MISKRSRQHYIFVVDDEQTIASSISIILRHRGFDTSSFIDPGEALEAAMSKAPDLLISDVVLPKFSGIELAIKIRGTHPRSKVLLFSGHASTSKMLDDANAKGHNFELLSKPIHPVDLMNRVYRKLGL